MGGRSPPWELLPESEIVHEYHNRKFVKYGHLIFHMPIPVASVGVNKFIYGSDISSICLPIFVGCGLSLPFLVTTDVGMVRSVNLLAPELFF